VTVPGEVLVGEAPVELFADVEVRSVEVVNAGDRPIQVGSHYHFAEVNPSLSFDRAVAHGHRLAIPAGTSVRFEPGIERLVELVPLAGARIVPGLRGAVGGHLDGRAGSIFDTGASPSAVGGPPDGAVDPADASRPGGSTDGGAA
jgi:urease subunit beta